MGKFVLRDAYIAINGTSLSDHCHSLELEDKADDVDFTAFSPAAYKEWGVGFKDCTVTAEFFSDFAASSIHSILQPLYASGGTFALKVRPTSATISDTNPEAQMTARLYNYSGIAGKIGDAATFSVPFRNASTAGLVWATA